MAEMHTCCRPRKPGFSCRKRTSLPVSWSGRKRAGSESPGFGEAASSRAASTATLMRYLLLRISDAQARTYSQPFVEKGQVLPDGFPRLIEDAGQAMAGLVDAHGQPYTSPQSGLDGTMDLIFLLCDGEPAGVMSCEVKEDDAQWFFCHVREGYKAFEGQFFTMAVSFLKSAGMQVVRTNFLWPSPDRCIAAAGSRGFMPIERIQMARESDTDFPARLLPEGTEIVPWSDSRLDQAAWLLSENGNGDRPTDLSAGADVRRGTSRPEQRSPATCTGTSWRTSR